MASWIYKAKLADVLLQSRELKAEARNLQMKLDFLDRHYPLPGKAAAPSEDLGSPPGRSAGSHP